MFCLSSLSALRNARNSSISVWACSAKGFLDLMILIATSVPVRSSRARTTWPKLPLPIRSLIV